MCQLPVGFTIVWKLHIFFHCAFPQVTLSIPYHCLLWYIAYFTPHLQCLCTESNHVFILILIDLCIRHCWLSCLPVILHFRGLVFSFTECFHHLGSFALTCVCKTVPMVTLLNISVPRVALCHTCLQKNSGIMTSHPCCAYNKAKTTF